MDGMDKVEPINWQERAFTVSRHEIAGREDNIAQRRFLWDCFVKLKELIVPLRGKDSPDDMIMMWESDFQLLVRDLTQAKRELARYGAAAPVKGSDR